MKEVTRIRVAKTSYDIELGAKKQLEAYIQALSLYAEDDNVLEDIEIRITELLAERGVTSNDVIGADDVQALRDILGEPKSFSAEGDIAIGDEDTVMENGRKWYRDIDRAVLGGVLSGLARYFGANPLWVRLGFIAVLFVTFGLALFVYIILWIIVPAAVTVTEKLQAKGEPVTLAAIRRQSEGDEGVTSTVDRIRTRRRIFGVGIGIVGLLGVLAGAVATIWGGFFFGGVTAPFGYLGLDKPYIFGLFIASGVLFTVFWALIAYAGFRAAVTKRIVFSVIAVIVLGIGSFVSGSVLFGQEAWHKQDAIQRSIKDRAVTLPVDFDATKSLIIDAQNVTVEYRASIERRAVLTSVPGIKVELKNTEEGVRVTSTAETQDDVYLANPTLVVYGPELEKITITQGFVHYTSMKSQPIQINATRGQVVLYGIYSKATFVTAEEGFVEAEGANIVDVIADSKAGGAITLGNIATLDLTQPTTCPSSRQATIDIENVADGKITYNGVLQTVRSEEYTCGQIRVNEDDYDYEYNR